MVLMAFAALLTPMSPLSLPRCRIKTTASQPVYDDRGKELFGPIADKEREDRYLDMSRERERIEAEHDHAKAEVEIAMKQRIGSKLELKRGNVDEASSKCTWVLYFSGINKARFENLVAHKTDWNGIRLAVGWSGRPPYTCRGSVPDGSKPFIPDLRDFLVNMHGVRVTRLEDGFGTFQEVRRHGTAGMRSKVSVLHEQRLLLRLAPLVALTPLVALSTPAFSPQLDRQSTDIRGKRFQFYHGTFKEGKKDGYGIWYTDEGIFSGQVKDNQPCGKGRMDYANGDSVTGEFRVSRGHKESVLGENPYARGEPNGKCTRTFADGSYYEGQMKDGKINGEGTFINAMGEVRVCEERKTREHRSNGHEHPPPLRLASLVAALRRQLQGRHVPREGQANNGGGRGPRGRVLQRAPARVRKHNEFEERQVRGRVRPGGEAWEGHGGLLQRQPLHRLLPGRAEALARRDVLRQRQEEGGTKARKERSEATSCSTPLQSLTHPCRFL